MLPAPESSSFTRDAAELLGGASSLERLSGLSGVPIEAVRELLTDPQIQRSVERELAQAEQSGELVRWRAREGLASAVARLQQVCADQETSPGTLIKAGELLAKLAGLAQPAPAVPTGSGFSITIVLPESAKPQMVADAIDVQPREVSSNE